MLRSLSPKRSRTLPDRDTTEDASPQNQSPPSRRLSSSSKRRRSFKKDRRPGPGPELADTEDPAKFEKEWGMSKDKEEELLQKFRVQLKEEGALKPFTDKYYLRRFLRARQHDLKKAKAMFLGHMEWRREFGTDSILDDFHFHERDAFISMYPQGYHKTDKLGRPIYIQHLGAINVKRIYELTTEERTLKFHVQEYERCARYIMPACSRIAGHHIDTTFAIIDMKGVGLKHLTGDVKKMMSKVLAIDQNNYPEMLGRTVIINAPSIFKMLFGAIKPMLDARTQGKIEVAGTNFLPQLLNWVDRDNLPDYLGGTSSATLLDDAGPWQDANLIAELDAQRAQSGQIQEQPEAEAEAGGRSDTGARPLAQSSPAAAANDDGAWGDASPQMQRQNSVATSVGDDGYYSPREDSISEEQWDLPPDHLGSAPDLAAVSAWNNPLADKQIPILARVQALEAGVPGQQERLSMHLDGKGGPAPLAGQQAPLMTRVEALERAMAALLKAQEQQNNDRRKGEPPAKAKTSCCGCSIM